MDGEKAPVCYKEITTALRQWILPTFVSLPNIHQDARNDGLLFLYSSIVWVKSDEEPVDNWIIIYLCFHIGQEDEDINTQAPLCTPWPPGGPQEPDQEEAGQAARLRADLWEVESKLRGTGGGQHVQVEQHMPRFTPVKLACVKSNTVTAERRCNNWGGGNVHILISCDGYVTEYYGM